MININNELQIYRYKQGVMLLRPDESHPAQRSLVDTGNSVGMLSTLRFNTYIKNCQHELQYMNNPCLETMSYSSEKDILGKTIFDDIDPSFAEAIRSNNNRVIHQQRQFVLDEEGIRIIDGAHIHSLSIKMPWYDDNAQVIGTFGFGIIASRNAYAQSINQLLSMGLFPTRTYSRPKLSGNFYGSQYLTRRELDILELAVRGKTANETATILSLSKRTVEHYLENIKRKINVKSKSDMIEKAIDELRII